MATTIIVDASEIEQMAGQMLNASPVVVRESRVAMERSAILVQNAAKANIQRQGAIDTGQLINSIARQVEPFEAQIGSNKTYARSVEEGRQPGAPMPPSGALLGWMNRHGIPAEAEFVVRRSIKRRGIRPRPYLDPALEANRVAINREFAAANLRIAQMVTA